MSFNTRGMSLLVEALSAIAREGDETAQRALDDFMALADELADDPRPDFQPDLSDPGQALARRVQEALEREFQGEPIFGAMVVVEEPQTRRIGVAATVRSLEEADLLLMLGRGVVKRAIRKGAA
jgi:hypothetical protein